MSAVVEKTQWEKRPNNYQKVNSWFDFPIANASVCVFLMQMRRYVFPRDTLKPIYHRGQKYARYGGPAGWKSCMHNLPSKRCFTSA